MEVGAHAQAVEGRLGLPPLPHGRAHRARGQRRYLFEEAHPGAAPPPDLAFRGRISAGDDPQEGRFPGAVDPHHPNPVTVRDGEGELLEEHPIDPADGNLLEIDEEGHEATRVSAGGSATGRATPVGSRISYDGHNDISP